MCRAAVREVTRSRTAATPQVVAGEGKTIVTSHGGSQHRHACFARAGRKSFAAVEINTRDYIAMLGFCSQSNGS